MIQSYEIILKALMAACADIPRSNQTGNPELSGLELTTLNLPAEFMMYNSKEQLFRVIKNTYLEGKTERNAYNRWRRKPFAYMEQLRRRLCGKFASMSDIFHCQFHARGNP